MYVRQVILIDNNNLDRAPRSESEFAFSNKDQMGIIPHADAPMVTRVHMFTWSVKRVLIDPGSSANLLYYDTFEKLGLNLKHVQLFKGSIVGFLHTHHIL